MAINSFKNLVKKIFPLTHNIRYDNQTFQIMKIVLEADSTFVDVGCHKGEVFDHALKCSPKGKHFAFEPIPDLFSELKTKYKDICEVKNYAITDSCGESEFHYVVSNPAYSGIKKRSYPKDEIIDKIKIKTSTLDKELINELRVDLIKIDVEGGEYGVLKGAKDVIEKFHPVFIFEHGLGASNFYNTDPDDVYELLDLSDYNIFTLKGFIKQSPPLSKEKLSDLYNRNKEYYFLATFRV